MTSKIIELKQQNSLSHVIDDRGDYIVNITDNILVNEGDQIIMKNCFLDTSASASEQIEIEEATPVTMTFVRYVMQNWDNTLLGPAQQPFDMMGGQNSGNDYNPPKFGVAGGLPQFQSASGFPLFETRCTYKAVDPTHVICLNVQVQFNVFQADGKTKKADGTYSWGGGLPLTVQYKDWDGSTKTFHENVPTLSVTLKGGFEVSGDGFYENKMHLPCIDKSILNISSDAVATSNDYDNRAINKNMGARYTPNPDVAPNYRKLVENTLTFTIPAGTYSPLEIANLISKEAQSGSSGDFVSTNGALSNNPCLSYVANTFTNTVDPAYPVNANQFSSTGYRIDDDDYKFSPQAFTFRDTGVWAGASQVALEFDSEQNKFFWSYIHTPAYKAPVGSATAGDFDVSITAEADQPGINVNGAGVITVPAFVRYTKKAGGIMFTSLSPPDLWHSKLGFDLGSLCAIPEYQEANGDATNQNPLFPIADMNSFPTTRMLKEGQNATAPRIVSSMNIQKNSTFQSAPPPTSGIPTGTVEVYATNQILEANLKNGYFYVDVISNFENSITENDNTTRNTVAIVSNYYNANSFTTGTSNDSIIYTHKGQPQKLSNFRVRILDENRQYSSDLGNNNVVFLEVIQNNSLENAITNLKIESQAEQIIKNN